MKQYSKLARAIGLLCIAATLGVAGTAVAGSREQAKRMHDRLAGTPPSDAVLTQMQNLIDQSNPTAAATIAMSESSFYTVTLKNFAAPWTNRDQSVFVPLNDYTATVIGMVRDDVPFNQVLSADIVYIGQGVSGLPAYSAANNDHYQYLDDNNVDLSDTSKFVRTTQSAVEGIPTAATAGIITTRAAAAAFFVAGTNRAMFRYTMMNHLCHDMPTVLDITRSPDRIRQDVSRSPGGDSRTFLNNCIGCHSGMDPMAQAFAYYNFDATSGQLVYTPGAVQAKYLINANNFKNGYVTPDDHWDNRWRAGQNALLGWDAAQSGSGTGAKSLGQELAGSDAFAQCQVQKVFQAVCLRTPADGADRGQITSMVNSFKSGGYKLKSVFGQAATYCMGN